MKITKIEEVMIKTNLKEVREKLEAIADMVSIKKNGNFIARLGYFYRHGYSEDKLAEHILKALGDNIEIVDKGDHWTAFNGGAPLQRQSHWWVEFKQKENTTQ